MIHAAFISRNDDWILPHKLRVLSCFCDRVFVFLDRSPQSEAICRRFAKVDVRHWTPSRESFPMAVDGPMWDEGAMRQAVWDWATECNPKWVVLGDTDEIPAPSIMQFMAENEDSPVDCWLADWMNLVGDAGHVIGGNSRWSYQMDGSNKKGMIIRYRQGKEYRYRTGGLRHVRMEPSPLHEARSLTDDRCQVGPVPLVHYKWANWPRWDQMEESKLPTFNPWPPEDSTTLQLPRQFLWRWDADGYLANLQGSIAVVGNGPISGHADHIDSHDHVIRMNNFEIDGHSSNVGTRTTCWYVNCWDDLRPRPWTGDMLTGYVDAEQPARLSRWLGMYPHMHVPLGESWFDAARTIKRDSPSHGLTLLARLAHHGKRVNAYGFDGMRTGHYFDVGHKHDHTPEQAALKLLPVSFR
jgi:hypothetical protein